MTRTLTVLAPGPLTTVQDDGRPGQAALGIGRSGALYRLCVPDPSDFHLIVSLVGSYGQTAA